MRICVLQLRIPDNQKRWREANRKNRERKYKKLGGNQYVS